MLWLRWRGFNLNWICEHLEIWLLSFKTSINENTFLKYADLILERLVNAIDQPGEGAPINGFGKCIPDVDGVVHREGAHHLKHKARVNTLD